ncbi:MAG: hypothetical protein ABIR16_00900 [Dokdonella sp.]
MTRQTITRLVPSILIALGIIAASLVARFGVDAGWPLLTSVVVLVISIITARIVDTRLHDNVPATSVLVRAVVGAILVAVTLLFLDDPTHLRQMIPILGATAWVSLLQRPRKPAARASA